MRKRLVAAALAACSTLVVAENIPVSSAVPMSDAELDQVTAAAAAQHQHLIINSGNAVQDRLRGDPLTPTFRLCVNCPAGGGGAIEGRARGMHVIFNGGHPTTPILHCFGGFTGC